MKFMVLFTDNEEFSGKRQEHMKEHLAFLQMHSKMVQAAGPIFHTTDGSNAGGMWVVEADTEDQVKQLVQKDPFYPSGLRKDIDIREWRLVFQSAEFGR